MDNNYKKKYLKYKNKYIQLKNQQGGFSSCINSKEKISPDDDFDELVPSNEKFKIKPNNKNINSDDINLDLDGHINLKEKHGYEDEHKYEDESTTASTDTIRSNDSFISKLFGSEPKILYDPEITAFTCKNKNEINNKYKIDINKIDLHENINFEEENKKVKTNLLNNEIEIKNDLQCYINFINDVLNKFKNRLIPIKIFSKTIQAKLKKYMSISINDQEHFIDSFNNINYIYTIINKHNLKHNLVLTNLHLLDYFKYYEKHFFIENKIISKGVKNSVYRFITNNFNEIKNIIKEIQSYIDLGHSSYIFRETEK
jgi:hypothetical protein